MRLTEREIDKMLVSLAAMIARDRRARGVKLNYPESVAFIASGLMERAREAAGAVVEAVAAPVAAVVERVEDAVAAVIGSDEEE